MCNLFNWSPLGLTAIWADFVVDAFWFVYMDSCYESTVIDWRDSPNESELSYYTNLNKLNSYLIINSPIEKVKREKEIVGFYWNEINSTLSSVCMNLKHEIRERG